MCNLALRILSRQDFLIYVGIVGYVGKKGVVPVIIEGLRSLEYRGYDSAGIAVCGNGNGGALQVRPG